MNASKLPAPFECSIPLSCLQRTGQKTNYHIRQPLPSATPSSSRRQAAGARVAAVPTEAQPGDPDPTQLTSSPELSPEKSVWPRVKSFFLADRIDRKRLAELGLGAVASYGFVSNATYGTGMAVSWVAFVKQYGVSPLMPGQWKAFMAWYAGFWTIQHFLRPFRFSLAIALSPAFDKFITWTQKRTGFSRRNAFGVYLTLLGTLSSFFIFGSIFLFAGPLAFARRPLPA